MAGHSKWANIKHRKAAQDQRRGKIFTKIAKEITVAAKLGGGDIEGNARLRAAVMKARVQSMPKDNIDRAIKKGVGDMSGVDYAEKVYEGYGAGGVAFVVECLTDNINRTVSEVRFAFNKGGGNLGTDGSVSWMFKPKGLILFEKDKVTNFDQLFESAIENGAEDVKEEEDSYEIVSDVAHFMALKEAIDKLGLPEPSVAEITRIAENHTAVTTEQAESIRKMVDMLEDNDDVQNVYHNAELPEDA